MADAEYVHLGAGVVGPTEFSTDDLPDGWLHEPSGRRAIPARVNLTLKLMGRVYEIDSVRMTRHKGGPELTSKTIRRVPFDALHMEALTSTGVVFTSRPLIGIEQEFPGVTYIEMLADLAARGPTDDTLRMIANFYVYGEAVNIPPARHIAAFAKMPLPTVNNWIRRAKDKGYIPPVGAIPEPYVPTESPGATVPIDEAMKGNREDFEFVVGGDDGPKIVRRSKARSDG